MAELILKTQQSSPFIASAPNKLDISSPEGPKSVMGPTAQVKNIAAASNSAPFAFGKVAEIILNRDEIRHLNEIVVHFTFGTLTAGNYCKYPAMSAITRIELLDGSDVEHDYTYRETMNQVLSTLSDEKRNSLLTAAGGTAFASGDCYAVIPMFCSKWVNKGERMPSFPLHKCSNNLRLRVHLDTAANIAASGATVGSPTIAGEFLIYSTYQESDGDRLGTTEVYQSFDWETPASVTTIATATATDLVLDSATGTINSIWIQLQLASDVDTNHYYILRKTIDVLNLQVGTNKTFYEQQTANEGLVDQVINDAEAGYGALTDLQPGSYYIALGSMYNPRTFTGGLNMKNKPSLRANIKHSLGANAYANAVCVRSAQYKIVGGRLKRELYE